MPELCYFCGDECSREDETTYFQVTSWVHGKKLDSPTMREQTGNIAHRKCILKVEAGQAPDQPELLNED